MRQGPYCFCFKTFILTQEVCLYCSAANNQSSLIAEHSRKMGLMEKPNCRFYLLPVLPFISRPKTPYEDVKADSLRNTNFDLVTFRPM